MTQPFGTLVLSDTFTSTRTNTGVDGPCHQLVWAWWCPVGIPGEGATETAGGGGLEDRWRGAGTAGTGCQALLSVPCK